MKTQKDSPPITRQSSKVPSPVHITLSKGASKTSPSAPDTTNSNTVKPLKPTQNTAAQTAPAQNIPVQSTAIQNPPSRKSGPVAEHSTSHGISESSNGNEPHEGNAGSHHNGSPSHFTSKDGGNCALLIDGNGATMTHASGGRAGAAAGAEILTPGGAPVTVSPGRSGNGASGNILYVGSNAESATVISAAPSSLVVGPSTVALPPLGNSGGCVAEGSQSSVSVSTNPVFVAGSQSLTLTPSQVVATLRATDGSGTPTAIHTTIPAVIYGGHTVTAAGSGYGGPLMISNIPVHLTVVSSDGTTRTEGVFGSPGEQKSTEAVAFPSTGKSSGTSESSEGLGAFICSGFGGCADSSSPVATTAFTTTASSGSSVVISTGSSTIFSAIRGPGGSGGASGKASESIPPTTTSKQSAQFIGGRRDPEMPVGFVRLRWESPLFTWLPVAERAQYSYKCLLSCRICRYI